MRNESAEPCKQIFVIDFGIPRHLEPYQNCLLMQNHVTRRSSSEDLCGGVQKAPDAASDVVSQLRARLSDSGRACTTYLLTLFSLSQIMVPPIDASTIRSESYPSCECEVASGIFVPVSGEGATRFLPLPFEPHYPIGSNRLQFEATRLSLAFRTSPRIDSTLAMFAFCVWQRSEYNNPCVHEPCWEIAQRTRQRRWAQPPDSLMACKQGEYFVQPSMSLLPITTLHFLRRRLSLTNGRYRLYLYCSNPPDKFHP